MTSSNSGSKGLWVKVLVAALVLAAGALYPLAWRKAPETHACDDGCLPGQHLLIPSGMAVAYFVDTRAVGCGTLPNMAVVWAQVFQAGHR